MSMTDINIARDYPEHRKTKRLMGLLGPEADAYPIRLWCYCARYHAVDGQMVDYSAAEVEAAVGWRGASGALVAGLLKVGFLEIINSGRDGYACHDWMEHESHITEFAAAGQRMRAGRAKSLAQALPQRNSVIHSLQQPLVQSLQQSLPQTTQPNLPTNITKGVPSKGVESETKTKTPPTQSIIKDARPAPQPAAVHREPAPARDKYGKVIPLSTPGGGPLLRNFGGEPILYPRFDLMIEGESHSYPENRVKPPPHDPGEGKKWCWRPEALCWYVYIIDDKKNFTYGVPTVKYERMSFREQEKLELESEGSMYYDAAMNCYYSESSRRTKAREDADGTTERNEAADAAAVKERFAKIKVEREERKAEQAKLSTPGKARKFFK